VVHALLLVSWDGTMLNARSPLTSIYQVEVSGWDSSQSFFVEKSGLEWNEETGKRVMLTRAVREGSILFVRLLQPIAQERSYPVAYVAEAGSSGANGQFQFRLKQVQPGQNEKLAEEFP
jgi:hypothetical protein